MPDTLHPGPPLPIFLGQQREKSSIQLTHLRCRGALQSQLVPSSLCQPRLKVLARNDPRILMREPQMFRAKVLLMLGLLSHQHLQIRQHASLAHLRD